MHSSLLIFVGLETLTTNLSLKKVRRGMGSEEDLREPKNLRSRNDVGDAGAGDRKGNSGADHGEWGFGRDSDPESSVWPR